MINMREFLLRCIHCVCSSYSCDKCPLQTRCRCFNTEKDKALYEIYLLAERNNKCKEIIAKVATEDDQAFMFFISLYKQIHGGQLV